MSNKNTAFQNLTKILNFDGFETTSNNTKNKKVIIKGDSVEDVQRKRLELAQKESLEKRFFNNIESGFQKSMQYEAARLPAFLDYEGMEYYPMIASALDLYMEEVTNLNEKGEMLNIYSNNERIKNSLEDLMFNVININVNLPFWTRSMIKYGDNFVNIVGEKGKGITNARQMVNYDIERSERVENGIPIIKFKNRLTSDVYNVFEILHFRLLGDSRYLPYGSSILSKVRRVWRQCLMAEDAMLTYRIVRAGDRRVYKIDVGNMDVDDIDEYIYKVATSYKKKQSINPENGQIDYRFNMLGNDEDIYLPVRNGNTQTGVETLDGMKTTDIHDIEYLRDNLFTGLSIPKPFLGFQDASGGGKNMAQHDIRFAKKVIRIQQSILQELNKLAIIHLYLQGFSKDDLQDFKLTLNNPSTQEETLRVELMSAKATLYADLTKNEGGIAIMSHTKAKRLLFNMSDNEIINDLKQQKIERAVGVELENTGTVIKRTGIFDEIDKKFGGKEPLYQNQNDEQTNNENPDNEEQTDDTPNEFQNVNNLPEPEGIGDSYYRFNNLIENLRDNKKKQTKNTNQTFINENNILNSKTINYINEIDALIDGDSLNKKDLDIDDSLSIDDIEVD